MTRNTGGAPCAHTVYPCNKLSPRACASARSTPPRPARTVDFLLVIETALAICRRLNACDIRLRDLLPR